MARPNLFPELPEQAITAQLTEAFNIISENYNAASQLLREESDAIRLRLCSDRLETQIFPLLEALERVINNDEWITNAAEIVIELQDELLKAADEANIIDSANVHLPTLVHFQYSGNSGHPKKIIDEAWLRDAMSDGRHISQRRLAKLLKISKNTLKARMYEYGLHTPRGFDTITNEEMDILMKSFKEWRPMSGRRYAIGYLRQKGIRVQQERVRLSLKRVDGVGQILRRRAAVQRRTYSVPRSNYLWHMDGHHKLIAWGIVIHGVIDGFCRTVTGLQASTDNKASTALQMFLSAVNEYGSPSRVRGDRGGENIEVATYMVMHKGPNRGSFLWGPSMRNTRIERLWVEVGSQFVRSWRAFFARLERLHRLQKDDPYHLWLLHHLFLPRINDDCERFKEEWNRHPISGPSARELSPMDMRFLSEAERGVAFDNYDGVHPDILSRYYGFDEADDNIDNDAVNEIMDNLQVQINDDEQGNIRHDAVEAPVNSSPFDLDTLHIFEEALRQVQLSEIVPDGYGVAEEDIDDDGYPEHEVLKIGRKQKEFTIQLPVDIWWPRAVAWTQGVKVMTELLLEEEIGR